MSEQLAAIRQAIVEGEDGQASTLVSQALDAGLPPLDILQQGEDNPVVIPKSHILCR